MSELGEGGKRDIARLKILPLYPTFVH